MELGANSYDITLGRGILCKAGELMKLSRKVFIVTDENVPREYSEAIKTQCKEGLIYTVPAGEGSKSLEVLGKLLSAMLDFGLSRGDSAIAVGGGVVGDLTAFASSVYMRGIDFYNIPTTLLSSLDSSIGGKTGVNLSQTKNIVGTFYQPKAVIIDLDTLKTLPERHISAGLAEAIKMALTSDAELFSLIERGVTEDNLEQIVFRSLLIKKAIVEEDEKESGLRKILNFGHTAGHGIEAEEGGALLHGECVALGMLPVASEEVRERLIPILEKLNLPTEYTGDIDSALLRVKHDKKAGRDTLDAIYVDKIGSFRIERCPIDKFIKDAKAYFARRE